VFEPAEDAADVSESERFRPAGTAAGRVRSRHRASAPAGALLLASSGLIESDDVGKVLAWENSGFSLDTSVRDGAHDRAGLERLLR
jgi:hypothetical protein